MAYGGKISVVLGLLAVAMCAGTLRAEVQPDAVSRARTLAISREQMYVADVLREVKGYQAWSDGLRGFYDDLRRLPGSLSVDPGNGTLVLSQIVDYQLRGDRTLTSGEMFDAEDARIVQIIAGFADQLRGRGIDLIVVPVPTKLDIYPQHLSKTTKAGALVSLPLVHLVDELLAADIEVINLLQDFREAAAAYPRSPLYYRTDHHWTAEGIQVGARAVNERLQRYALQRVSPVRYTIKRVDIQHFLGKIVVSTIPEDRQRLYPPEAIYHMQVFDRAGNSYDDDDSSPILVMGDSFVLSSFQEPSYGFTANLAYELGMPVSGLVTKGSNVAQGPRMLARKGRDFIDTKRVVVWVLSASSFGNGPWNWADAEINLP